MVKRYNNTYLYMAPISAPNISDHILTIFRHIRLVGKGRVQLWGTLNGQFLKNNPFYRFFGTKITPNLTWHPRVFKKLSWFLHFVITPPQKMAKFPGCLFEAIRYDIHLKFVSDLPWVLTSYVNDHLLIINNKIPRISHLTYFLKMDRFKIN